jgi:hypothetical protein
MVSKWSSQALVESPSHLRRHREDLMVVLLAALIVRREGEITDSLVELFISTVHRIGARAERRVNEELLNAFKRVSGKENILFSIAEASLEQPDGPVRKVVFGAVDGGEQTLRDLVREFKTNGPTYRRTVQTTLRGSYSNHYRRGLIELLDVLEFRSNNSVHRPMIDALDLVRRHCRTANMKFYPFGESVPLHAGTAGDWAGLVFTHDSKRRQRVNRGVYEIVTFQVLRERLRCRACLILCVRRRNCPERTCTYENYSECC